ARCRQAGGQLTYHRPGAIHPHARFVRCPRAPSRGIGRPSVNREARRLMADSITLRADALTRAIEAIATAAGSAPPDAALVASNLVEANLMGHDSHGVGMMPRYVSAILEGGLTVNQHVTVRFDGGALLALDGGQGYGQVIGREAMDLGIERARQH